MSDETREKAQKGNILIVDDDKFLLNMYAMKFSQQGFTIHSCLSVHEALEALRKGFAADVIVFDLIMPEFDGFSFLQSLSKEGLAPHAIKVALTNQNDEGNQNHAKELGADMCLVKAMMIPSEVVNTISTALASRA
ncbi:MAG TPA: response regulator [Candidatus Paceibacterota bacterium]|nr:response regulator [Candidatus Paceibacterota bacterium]